MTSFVCRLVALNGLLLILWISTRISDVGEISLYTQGLRSACIVKNQGTYGRWAGVQIRCGDYSSLILISCFRQTMFLNLIDSLNKPCNYLIIVEGFEPVTWDSVPRGKPYPSKCSMHAYMAPLLPLSAV